MNLPPNPPLVETLFAGYFARQVRKAVARMRRRIVVGLILATALLIGWALASAPAELVGLKELAIGAGLCLTGWFVSKYAKRLAARRALRRRRWARILPFLRFFPQRSQSRDVMTYLLSGFLCFGIGLLVFIVGLKQLLFP